MFRCALCSSVPTDCCIGILTYEMYIEGIVWAHGIAAVCSWFLSIVSAFGTGPTRFPFLTYVLFACGGMSCATTAWGSRGYAPEEDRVDDALVSHWRLLAVVVASIHFVESYRFDAFVAFAPVLFVVICGPGSAAVVLTSTLIAAVNAPPLVTALRKVVPHRTLFIGFVASALVCSGVMSSTRSAHSTVLFGVLLLTPFCERWWRDRYRADDAQPFSGDEPAEPSLVRRCSLAALFAVLAGASLVSWGGVVGHVATALFACTWGDCLLEQTQPVLVDLALCGASLMAVLAQGPLPGKDEQLPDILVPAKDRRVASLMMLLLGPTCALAFYWAHREAIIVASLVTPPAGDPFAHMSLMSPLLRRRRSSGSSGDERATFHPFDSLRVDRRSSGVDDTALDTFLTPPQDPLPVPIRRRRSSGDQDAVMTFSSPRTSRRTSEQQDKGVSPLSTSIESPLLA